MNNYVKLLNNLEELGLHNIKNNLDKYLDLVASGEKSMTDALYELSNLEIKAKEERTILGCVRVANFPFIKGIEDFDFSFQPSINKKQIMDLMSLRFLEGNENILFVGTPGVGKTHLATAIGIECAKRRLFNIFYTFSRVNSSAKKSTVREQIRVQT